MNWGKFLFPLFFYCSSSKAASFDVNAFKQAFESVNSFEFRYFDPQLKSSEGRGNKEFSELFGVSYASALEIIGSGKKDQLNRWDYLRELALDNLELYENQPWVDYARSELLIIWGFARMRAGERIFGASDVKSAYELTNKVLASYPDFLPAKKNRGLLRALIGLIPSEYKKIAEFLGFQGSVSQGIQELSEVYRQASSPANRFLREQAGFLWLIIQKNYGTQHDLQQAINKIPISDQEWGPLRKYAMASSWMALGKRAEAERVLFSLGVKGEEKFIWLDWLRGNFLLQELHPEAEKYFNNFLAKNGHASYTKAALLRLSWLLQSQGKMMESQTLRTRVLKEGISEIDDDIEAMREVKSGILHEKCLLRARLLYDGGFYLESLKEINLCSPSSFGRLRHIEEYHYRLGRIYQATGNDSLALSMFLECLKFPTPTGSYYRPNSALMIALIHESRGNKLDAVRYYKEVLKFTGYEYQRSIEQKAKSGLRRLGVK